MSDLISRLREKLEFCESRAILELPLGLSAVDPADPNDIGNQLLRQLIREHAHQKPLLEKLIDCVEALKKTKAEIEKAEKHGCVLTHKSFREFIEPALSSLESVCDL